VEIYSKATRNKKKSQTLKKIGDIYNLDHNIDGRGTVCTETGYVWKEGTVTLPSDLRKPKVYTFQSKETHPGTHPKSLFCNRRRPPQPMSPQKVETTHV
jgi:hypothetical protein